MPVLDEIEKVDARPEDDNEQDLGPGLDPSEHIARVEHSKIVGDYYRDLSLNYYVYEREDELYRRTGGEHGHPWPDHPFPNERHTLHE